MNETTKKALEAYNKLKKEEIKAFHAKKEAEQTTAATWEAYDKATENLPLFNRVTTKHENELYKAFEEADKKQKAAADALRIAEAAANAAGINAARAAAEELKTAIIENPEKFTAPVGYKNFTKAVQKTLETDKFYIENDFYTVRVIFYPDYTRYSAYLTTTEYKGGEIDPNKINAGYYYIATAQEIKKEARQAAKDAKKIEELQKEAARKAEEIKAKYKTDIKNYLPLLHTLPVESARFYN